MPFYKDRLKARGLDVLVPDSDVPALNAIIYDELCHGVIDAQSREVYQQAIDEMASRGAQAVILGCTEITLLIKQEHTSLPVFDTTALHAQAAVDWAIQN